MGQTTKIRRVNAAMRKDIRRAKKMTIEFVKANTVNDSVFTVQNDVSFFVELTAIAQIMQQVLDVLINGDGRRAAEEQVRLGFIEGVARTVDNLSRLTDDYPRTVDIRIIEDPVLRRAALVTQYAGDAVRGYGEQIRGRLAQILYEAVLGGENPKNTATRIEEAFGVARSKALRLARTQVTMALRRGRWFESQEAEEKFGIKTMLLHTSALIPGRTRKSHAARHGRLVTVKEQAEFYAKDGNAFNCLCSSTEIVVDNQNNPIYGLKLIDRMRQARKRFLSTRPK